MTIVVKTLVKMKLVIKTLVSYNDKRCNNAS